MTNRYEDASFLTSGPNFKRFWNDYLASDRRVKYVVGLGFDPRTVDCLAEIHRCAKSESVDYTVIEYNDASLLNQKLKRDLKSNTESLEALVPRTKWNDATINTTDATKDVSVAASNSVRLDDLEGYTDLVLDINAMPVNIYFPIVRKIMSWIDAGKKHSPSEGRPNLHLVLSENPALDDAIRGKPSDDTIAYVHGFATRLLSQANSELPRVLIPLLGKGREEQLDRIYRQMDGLVEFCPCFPMPSVDPYRSRDLLLGHRNLLADGMGVNSKDYIYCHESDPFDVCKKIYNTAHLYYKLFEPMGGCKIVISPMSSKLMCVGALLAACELLTEGSEVGVVNVPASRYDVIEDFEHETSVLHSVCLAGECYG